MASYSEEKKKQIFDEIIKQISEGKSVRKAVKASPISIGTFFEWVKDAERLKQYTRARECCAEVYFEQIIEVMNHTEEDHTPFTGGNVIQRDRLKIDSLKWILARMSPRVYGDKVTLAGDAENPIEQKVVVEIKKARDLKNEESED
mgnify:CR=1 FL=1